MQDPFSISWSASAQRDLGKLPEKVVATAVVEFIYGGLADNPRRVGHELTLELAGLHSARRGDFRVLYRIKEDQAEVVIVNIDHRADVYRRR
jgi:mRNA interferase RelE/StbE